MVYRQYSYAALLVQLCRTIGAGMLPLLVQLCCPFGFPMLDQQYSYAGPLVYLCWTFGTRMLYFSGTACNNADFRKFVTYSGSRQAANIRVNKVIQLFHSNLY